MRRSILKSVALAAASLSVALLSTTPTQAATGASVELEFNSPDAKGLMLVDDIRQSGSRITIALGRLAPGHMYRMVVSSDSCSVPLAQAQRLAKVQLGAASASGSIFKTLGTTLGGGVWSSAVSARLMEEEGIYYFCRAVRHLSEPSGKPDGTYARISDGKRFGVTLQKTIDSDETSLIVALRGLTPNTNYRLVLSPLTCQQALEGDPDQPIIVGTFKADVNGMALKDRTETVNNEERIRSARTETVNNNETITCSAVKPFDLVQ